MTLYFVEPCTDGSAMVYKKGLNVESIAHFICEKSYSAAKEYAQWMNSRG